uniref:Uncharacterized protein n=1 Tax=Amphimedon queenslandica TaxID=400682 RepID=A0A1X7UPH3_AMPQE
MGRSTACHFTSSENRAVAMWIN